ncbi:MAG: FAD-dependent oxidoreductase, partial [Planctomycetota bacterium]
MIVKTTDKTKWAVVGGGMLGLTMAHRLAKSGNQVTLLEAAPQVGGLTSVWELGEITWDKYYHVILMTDTNLRDLLEEIELEDRLKWTETKTGFYTDGKHYSMSNTIEFLSFPPLKLIEKLRLGGTIFYASKIKNWKRLEKIGVEKWLRRWSGNGTFEKIWQPLLNAKLGESYKKTAASFIWAHINRMYKARRSGLKKEMFGYVEGGYKTIIERLVQKLNEYSADIKTSFPIQKITKQVDGRFLIDSTNGKQEIFDRVILTCPSSVVEKICPDLSQPETDKLANIDYLGIVCASMVVEKPLSPYYVTNITDDWVPMTAVIEMTNIVDTKEMG